MPVPRLLKLLMNTLSTAPRNGSRRTRPLRRIDTHFLPLWTYMTLSRKKVWTTTLPYPPFTDANSKLHPVQLSNRSSWWKRMEIIPFMVRHPGFHVALKFRKYSKFTSISSSS
jgi:hypothetical protein